MGVDLISKTPPVRARMAGIVGGSRPHVSMVEWDTRTEYSTSWWEWRPILALCKEASTRYGLNINFEGWDTNSGAGLQTQKECKALAKALTKVLDSIVCEIDDLIFVNMGSWVTPSGKVNLDVYPYDEIKDALNDKVKVGTIMVNSVNLRGKDYVPMHSTSKEGVKRFIKYLKECGGFEIY